MVVCGGEVVVVTADDVATVVGVAAMDDVVVVVRAMDAVVVWT